MKTPSSELERVKSNQLSLLKIAPNIVLLVDSNGTIEYMNPHSSVFFNQLVAKDGLARIRPQIAKIIKATTSSTEEPKTSVGTISDSDFECRISPFTGYKGDDLHWLILCKQAKKGSYKGSHSPREVDGKDFIGSSKEIQNLHSIITRVAFTDTTVLISGESGTGKELVAHMLMENSPRSSKPFLTINCNTISDLLLESELFGYEKGSFTGAHKQRKGKFEIADGGTMFLDEIGDISPRMQAALLRVLQHGEFTRVGGHTPIKVDVRIIAATNQDLAKSVKKGTFRLDLFYRLNIINISLPPLRQRKDDILELATHFINIFSILFDKQIDHNPEKIIKKLESYDWPGNVRELENVIHRAVLMCNTNALSNEDISFDMENAKDIKMINGENEKGYDDELPLKEIIEQTEKELINRKLKADRGNVERTAESLKISKAALYDKMKRYGISAKSFR